MICFALTTISLCGRIYVRFFTKQLFIGDYLLIMVYVTSTVAFAYSFRSLSSPGAFVHQWNVHMSALLSILWDVWIISNTQIATLTFVKVAILLEWVRIFAPNGTRNAVFWASYTLIWINVLFYIAFVIVLNVSCTPQQYTWNNFISGHCSHTNARIGDLTMSSINLSTDVLIFLIPQRVIWKLQMPANRKTAISASFAAGVLAISAASCRLVMTVIRQHSRDFTYNYASAILSSLAEITCAFLVICIPALPKAFASVKNSKIVSSMHRWTRVKKLRIPRKRAVSDKWPRSRSRQPRTYGRESIGVEEYRLSPAVELNSDSSIDRSILEHLGSGILRTTHFETREDYYQNVRRAEYPREYGLCEIV
ncbi:hypothetical protein F4805DRAFT_428263 [Annulohypoxylon moriforme]|nr:hypothetical protein F4805DRAFT_428263 [Annulohypoxylon moriforme]